MKLQELRQLIREELATEARPESTRMYNQILKRGVTNPPTEPDEFMAYYNLAKDNFKQLSDNIINDLNSLPKNPNPNFETIKYNLRTLMKVASTLMNNVEAHEKGENSIKY